MNYDRTFLQKIASSGGRATMTKYGKNYFKLLAKKSWIKRNAKKKIQKQSMVS